MAQSHTIKTSCAAAWMMLTFLGVAATTPPPKQSDAIAISVHDIDRDSVRVFAASDKSSARLSFLFRNKDAQQARSIVLKSRAQRIRITDGSASIVEAKLAGTMQDDSKKKGGLMLSFDTPEDASKAAAALRPYLK